MERTTSIQPWKPLADGSKVTEVKFYENGRWFRVLAWIDRGNGLHTLCSFYCEKGWDKCEVLFAVHLPQRTLALSWHDLCEIAGIEE
jgi:hypothetical protein